MNTETIDKLYKEHIAHDELPKEFQIGMECFLDALKAQSAATPPDVEQMAEDVLIKQHENWNPYEGTLKEGVIIPAMIAMYEAGQSAVQDATPQQLIQTIEVLVENNQLRRLLSEITGIGNYSNVDDFKKYSKHAAKLLQELSALRSELSAAQEENKRLRALGNSVTTPPESGEQTK